MVLKLEIEKQFPTPRDVAQLLWDNAILCEEMGFKFRPVVVEREVFKPQKIDVCYISKKTCEYFNIPGELFQSKIRKREIVQARQIAMYLSKNLTKESLVVIGEQIGDMDHATVLHACKTVNNLMDTDKQFKRQVDELERML